MVKWNVEPLPGTPSLSTHKLPPIRSHDCLLMAGPNPVPPYLRVVESALPSGIPLTEGPKETLRFVLREPDARIADGEMQLVAPLGAILQGSAGQGHAHFALLGELDRVGDAALPSRVDQDLAQAGERLYRAESPMMWVGADSCIG